MRYTIVLSAVLFMLLAGTAVAQENIAGDEEVTYAAVDPELADIRSKVNDVKETIQTDYEALLADEPEAAGTIAVSFSITPEGIVTDISVECPEELSALNENIVTALEGLEFDPASDRTENLPVTIPFTLTPPQ